MATILFAIVFGIGWVLAVLVAVNDFHIFVQGRIEDDTNPTGIPTEQLTGLAQRPGFIRFIAGFRLLFAAAWIVVVPVMAFRRWWS